MNQSAAKVGLVHPGSMGARVGAALTDRGIGVRWCSNGRSDETAARAQSNNLIETSSLEDLCGSCDVLISVVPPHAAQEQADRVVESGFQGVYVDANAIAPSCAREISRAVSGSGARYVDGSLIGPPPKQRGDTRLYLSGDGADEIASLFTDSILEARVIGSHDFGASALKMSYAAFSKGTSALLANIQQLARSEGVLDELLVEFDDDLPRLIDWCASADRRPHPKAWRFIGEMEQIAAAFRDQDLPDGFHSAAADVFRRIAQESDEVGME